MNLLRITLLVAVLICPVWLSAPVFADCTDCCLQHGGAVCSSGVTLCADGTPLSDKCTSCDKCTQIEDIPLNTEGLTGKAVGSEPARKETTAGMTSTSSFKPDEWKHWIDENQDCQDTKTEVLIRDNVGYLKFVRDNPCLIATGKWRCPYTGKVLRDVADVAVDHIVPLTNAHETGGAQWPEEKKQAFANDPDNLVTVKKDIKNEKADQSPDQWRPPNQKYWKEYAYRWRAVKEKYGLEIADAERKAIDEMKQFVITLDGSKKLTLSQLKDRLEHKKQRFADTPESIQEPPPVPRVQTHEQKTVKAPEPAVMPQTSSTQITTKDLFPDYQQALEYYNRILENHPDHKKALIYRGYVFIELKEVEKACSDFNRACDLGDCWGLRWSRFHRHCQ